MYYKNQYYAYNAVQCPQSQLFAVNKFFAIYTFIILKLIQFTHFNINFQARQNATGELAAIKVIKLEPGMMLIKIRFKYFN